MSVGVTCRIHSCGVQHASWYTVWAVEHHYEVLHAWCARWGHTPWCVPCMVRLRMHGGCEHTAGGSRTNEPRPRTRRPERDTLGLGGGAAITALDDNASGAAASTAIRLPSDPRSPWSTTTSPPLLPSSLWSSCVPLPLALSPSWSESLSVPLPRSSESRLCFRLCFLCSFLAFLSFLDFLSYVHNHTHTHTHAHTHAHIHTHCEDAVHWRACLAQGFQPSIYAQQSHS